MKMKKVYVKSIRDLNKAYERKLSVGMEIVETHVSQIVMDQAYFIARRRDGKLVKYLVINNI